MKKYLISKTPFIRSVDSGSMSTTRMMYDQLVVLVSFIMFGFVIKGSAITDFKSRSSLINIS